MSKRSAKKIANSIDTKKYLAQAEEAAEQARQAAKQATVAAKKASHKAAQWAGPQLDAAVEWGKPRAKHAYHSGAQKAQPYVRKAGARASEWTDIAHAAIVGAAIPAVMDAVDDAAHDDDDRGNGWLKIFVPVALGVVAGAALIAWARRDPGRDDWAGEDEEWEFTSDASLKDQLRHNINKAADSATVVAKKAVGAAGDAASSASDALNDKASPAVAKVKETALPAADRVRGTAVTEAKKVADKAGPAINKVRDTAVTEAKRVADAAGLSVGKVKDSAVTETKRVKDGIDEARQRATAEVVSTFDDAEDVWEDEAASGETPTVAKTADKKPSAAKKPAAKKPAPKTGGSTKK